MATVVAASVVLAWQLGEDVPDVERVGDVLLGPILVPALWLSEVANGLVVAERKGRITAARRSAIASAFAELDIEIRASPGVAAIADLALRTGLSAYDAEYLHLSTDRGAALLTFDRQLAEAGRLAGVTLV